MRLNKKLRKRLYILFVFVIITLSVLFVSILSVPKFPVFKDRINMTRYENCLKEKEHLLSTPHAPGNLVIRFGRDVMNDEAKHFLEEYNLGTSRIDFPSFERYWAVFSGNDQDYIDYLLSTGEVVKAKRWHGTAPHIEVDIYSNNTYDEAISLLRNFENGTVGKITGGHNDIWGVTYVEDEDLVKYICELSQYEIVTLASINGISHTL